MNLISHGHAPGAWHRARPAAMLAGLALAGCSTLAPLPPDSSADARAVPAAWAQAGVDAATAATPATPLADWWRRFDDPLLVQLVEQSQRANTSLRSARAALDQARALARVQRAGAAPTLDASGSAQRSKNGEASASNRFGLALDAAWSPDLFGGQRAAVAAADAAAMASQASLGQTQVSVAAEVALAYLGLRGTQARSALAEQSLQVQLQTLQITQWRQQAGLVTVLDTEQARSAVEQTRAALPALSTAQAQAVQALAVLSGQPVAELQSLLTMVRALPRPPAALALALPAETLRQRADVQAAEQQVQAAWARVAQADAARRPSLRLSGSLGLSALTLGGLGSGGALAASVLGGVSWPLLDGGAAGAQVQAQQAALEQARAGFEVAVQGALKEVEDALVALRGDRQRASSLQLAADAAAHAAQLARQRYASGLVDFQVVLETQRTQIATQDSLAQAQAEIGADHVRLYRALGGGWQPLADTGKRSSQDPGAAAPLSGVPAARPEA